MFVFFLYKQQQNSGWLFQWISSFQGTSWFGNKVHELIIMGGLIIGSGLINLIAYFLKVPLALTVTQRNSITPEENSTTYVRRETSEKRRTIKLSIEIRRKKGLNFVVEYLIKKYSKIFLLIKCRPPGLELQANSQYLKPEILPTEDGTGFFIDITDFLTAIAEDRETATPVKDHYFFIKETKQAKTFINGNMTTYINPKLLIDNFQPAPWYFRWALFWNPEQHEIKFDMNGGK